MPSKFWLENPRDSESVARSSLGLYVKLSSLWMSSKSGLPDELCEFVLRSLLVLPLAAFLLRISASFTFAARTAVPRLSDTPSAALSLSTSSFTNSKSSSSRDDGLSSGFMVRHLAMKSSMICGNFVSSRTFGGEFIMGMRKIALIGCMWENGGTPSAISMTEMPSDQMSALKSYESSLMTSGAIQKGVPINVLRLASVSFSCVHTPKSASLTAPSSVKRILLHLMSR
mmetsp:Transcript_45517/g.67077  ORF Transcript_45517/g.67077 Transcript_45517/m.67077 type:complete len:228 (-) Transcript_45517:209-892(-)